MTTTETKSDRMAELLTAIDAAANLIRTNGLYAQTVECQPSSPGAFRYDRVTGDWDKPVIPKVSVSLFSHPHEFLTWCRVVHAERIAVKRRDWDTCLHVWSDFDGLTWNVNSSMKRPDSGPHLPGISPDWERTPSGKRGSEAWISVDDLATVLRTLDAEAGA